VAGDALTLVWLFLQLLLWGGLLIVLLVGLAVVVFAPPVVAGTWAWRRLSCSLRGR